MKQQKKDGLLKEAGAFCLDIAKLIFAGVILAGIMQQDLNYYLLFICGGVVVLIFVFVGFYLLSNISNWRK